MRVDRGWCVVVTESARLTVPIPGAAGLSPATGDYATIDGDPTVLRELLPRRTALVRRAPSGRKVQVLAAEIDTVWIVLASDRPTSEGRVERALAVALDGAVLPRLVLTKIDRPLDLATTRAILDQVAPATPRDEVAALEGRGLEALTAQLTPGRTIALLGESGSGKSTLVNVLAGAEVQRTADVRAGDRKGRHTTTARELVPTPGGGVLLDTPGVRELGVLGAARGVDLAFGEVNALQGHCRFRDCAHVGEPGCAIVAALDAGDLDPGRWQRYQVLAAEAAEAAAPDSARRGRRG